MVNGSSPISTRVRVNDYTNVHAVAELSDGQLYVVSTFVKASGGCSAPMAKNPEEATANLKQFPAYLNRWDSQQARNEGVFAH